MHYLELAGVSCSDEGAQLLHQRLQGLVGVAGVVDHGVVPQLGGFGVVLIEDATNTRKNCNIYEVLR